MSVSLDLFKTQLLNKIHSAISEKKGGNQTAFGIGYNTAISDVLSIIESVKQGSAESFIAAKYRKHVSVITDSGHEALPKLERINYLSPSASSSIFSVEPVTADVDAEIVFWGKQDLRQLAEMIAPEISNTYMVLDSDQWPCDDFIDNEKTISKVPVTTVKPKKIGTVFGLASLPDREPTLEYVISSIHNQVDAIELALNGYEYIPEWISKYPKVTATLTTNEKGDANKFLHIEKYHNHYYFSGDDDILYPPDYIETLKNEIDRTGGLVTLHGSRIYGTVRSYYRDRKLQSHCLRDGNETQVHVPGSGVSGFHTSKLKLKYSHFEAPNMADVFLGIQCHKQGVLCTAIAHLGGWVRSDFTSGCQTIFDTAHCSDEVQTRYVNSVRWA